MKTYLLSIGLLVAGTVSALTEKNISKEEYVELWRQVAVRQMIDNRIPASITLAQGILESASGNSDLAKKGNNHFGIKCHGWTGGKMYINDDTDNECFRVYANAEESYIDHGTFLTSKDRYAKLFTYEPTDYKSWAKGLKEAGYATNPKYPELLIDIIEALKLHELDALGNATPNKGIELTASTANGTSITLSENAHTVKTHENKVKFIVAKKGDTFYKIAKEFNLGLWQLYRYNDYGTRKDVLEEGDIVYIQPKRKKAKDKDATFQVSTPISLRQLSQQEAVKLESLMKMNNSTAPDEKINKGEKIILH